MKTSNAIFSLRIPKDELDSWRWYSKKLRTSVSLIIRVAVSEHLSSEKIQDAIRTGKTASDID
jgi:hypothetical protein